MTSQLVLVLAMAAADPKLGPADTPLTVVPWSSSALEGEVRVLTQRVRRGSQIEATTDAQDLLGLRMAVLHSAALSRSDLIRCRQRIDYALEQVLDRLRRRRSLLLKPRQRAIAQAPHKTSIRNARPASLDGGGASEVQQLISLIEATIQPESWAVNGGRGTIGYWSPGYALVIRNTQAAHAELGDLLSTLENQQR